jgi:CO/xanthine dehydrogenase Mo-binding subunit
MRIGAEQNGKITAIAHESWSGDLKGGQPEVAVMQTRLLYAGANRMTAMRLATLDLPRRQCHARAWRGTRPDGARNRYGRDGGEARHRSHRVQDYQ